MVHGSNPSILAFLFCFFNVIIYGEINVHVRHLLKDRIKSIFSSTAMTGFEPWTSGFQEQKFKIITTKTNDHNIIGC
jgi:hypothetical protein